MKRFRCFIKIVFFFIHKGFRVVSKLFQRCFSFRGKRMPTLSLQKFADLHKTNKTAVYRAAKALNIKTSSGLNDEAQHAIAIHMALTPVAPTEISAIVPTVETATITGSGPQFAIHGPINVNMVVVDGGADDYRAQERLADGQTQNMIEAILGNAAAQGSHDRDSADATVAAVKAAYINTRLGSFAQTPTQNVQTSQAQPTAFQSGNTGGM